MLIRILVTAALLAALRFVPEDGPLHGIPLFLMYLVPYLTFVRDNRKLICLMYDKHDLMGAEKMYTNWFREIFRPILTRFGVSDTEQPFIMIFFLKGLLGVVTEWIQTDCEMPIEEMIAIIRKCIIKP